MQNRSSRLSRTVRSAISYGMTAFFALLLVVSLVRPSSVLAAAGEGSAQIQVGTGGTSASDATFGSTGSSASVTVGTLSYIRLITTVGESGIAPGENNVTVQIPANVFPSGAWNTAPEPAMTDVNAVGEWNVVYSDTDAGATDNAAISFAASSATTGGLLSIQANQQMDFTDIILITFAVNGAYSSTSAAIDIAIDDTGASPQDIASQPTLTVAAADAAASVVVASPVVGAIGNTTLGLTLPVDLGATDTVVFDVPANLTLGTVALVSESFAGAGTFACTATDSNTITCTADGAITTGTGNIVMSGITSAYAATGQTISAVVVTDTGNGSVAEDSSGSVTNTTAADAAATVTVSPSTVSSSFTTVLNFTLPVALDAGDTVEFAFPSNIGIAIGSYTSKTFSGAGSFSCLFPGSIICTADGVIDAGTGSLTLSITRAQNDSYNNYAGTSDISSFEIEDEGVSANDIATDSSVALTDITAADAAASVVVASPAVGAMGNTTLTLTLPINLDANDTVDITFPAYMNVASVAFASETFAGAGTFSGCTASGQVVTCTVGGAITAGTGTVVMTGITGSYTGTTDITSVEVEDEGTASNDIATDSSVALTDIVAADAAASVTLGSSNVGSITTATVAFTAPVALASGDTVDIAFPSHMNVASAAISSGTFSGCSVSGQDVTCTVNGAISAGSVSFVISGVRATFTASTDITSFEVEHGGNSSEDIATDSVVSLTNSSSGSSSSSSGGGGGSSATRYAIRLTSPTEGDNLTPGARAEIVWVSSGTGNISAVNLAYSLDDGATYTTIVEGTANDASYEWTVPNVYADVIIRAQGTDLARVLATDESEVFSILGTKVAEDVDAEDVDVSEDSEEMLPTGTFMKSPSWSTVYYVEGSMRRPFLDAQTFFTYAESFDDVIEVDDAYLANYLVGKPMVVKAGVSLVKIQSVAKVYAVEIIDGVQTLRWITSEDVAKELFGNAWADYVIDVPPTAWTQFKVGEDVDKVSDITVDLENMKSREMIADLM